MAEEQGPVSSKTSSELFISYAREDAAVAKDLCDRLRRRGIDIWWDDRLKAGASFHQEIAEALNGAKIAVVLWSKSSVQSPWVLDEAGRARDAGKLMPLRIHDVILPLGFGTLHTPELTVPWTDEKSRQIDEFVASVENRLRQGAQPQKETTPRPDPPRPPGRPGWVLPAAGALLVAAAAVVFLVLRPKPGPSPVPEPVCGPAKVQALEYTDKALDVASSGNYQRALLYYDQAISADVSYQPAYLWRARSYLNIGQRARAEVDLKQLLRPPCCNDRVCVEARELLASMDSTGVKQPPDGGRSAPSHEALIRDMFADDKERRVGATTALVVEMARDPKIVPDAVGAALAQPKNPSGVVNTLVLLQNAPRAAIQANRDQIVSLLGKVRGNGQLTGDRVAKLEQTFPELRAAAPAPSTAATTYKVALSLIKVAEDGLINIPLTHRNGGTEWTFRITLAGSGGRRRTVLVVPVARYNDKSRPEVRPPNITGAVELAAGRPLRVTVNGTRTEGGVHATGEARWAGEGELRIPVQAADPGDGSFELTFQFDQQSPVTAGR